MNKEMKDISRKVDEKGSRNPWEHILNILKAGIATAPFCGGIASLMTDYIPSGRMKRLEEFTKQIANDLLLLQDRIDETRILTDEFAFVFERCFKGVVENYQKEKIDAFRGILLNTACNTNANDDEKEYFLNLVSSLSVLHIRILKFIGNPTGYLEDNGISVDLIQGGFSQFFPIAIPEVNLEVIKTAFDDLYQKSFLNTDKGIFSTMTSSEGLRLLGDRLTNLGRKFIEFCSIPQ